MNLTKAFDSVCNETLIHKFNKLGMKVIVLNWIKSYLQDKLKYVEITHNSNDYTKNVFIIAKN